MIRSLTHKAAAWLLAAAMLAPAGGAWAQKAAAAAPEAPPAAPTEPLPPVYEAQLLRLAEILGALHFLRGLCGGGDAAAWRAEMEALLAAESPPPLRRARLIGRFNHGVESFGSVYRSCTPSAQRSIARYLTEGGVLSADVRVRYSQ